MKTMSKKYLAVIAGSGVLIAGLLGYHWYQNKIWRQDMSATNIEAEKGIIAMQPSVESPSSSATIKIDGSGKYKLEILPPSASVNTQRIPSLDRPIVFPASFPEEARKIMSDKIAASVAVLKKSPSDFNEWLGLAIFRKTIDDFEGARQIWEFLTTTNPDQPMLFANLANLYAFELKDPVRAEENFAKALQKGPKEATVWRQAYEFYRYVRKDDARAKEILQKGIVETGSPDLKYLLDHYDEL